MALAWWLIAALILAVALVVIVVAIRRHSAAPGDDTRPPVLVVARVLAIVYAVIASIGTVVSVVTTLIGDTVAVSLPVGQFWPDVYPWITLDPAPAASVVGGGFTTADVSVAGLGMDARLLLAAGHALEGITFVLIAVVVALLCHRLLGGSPFRPLLARSFTLTAVAIAVGGIAWQFCYGIGGSIASHQVLEVTGSNGSVPSAEIGDYLYTALPGSGLPDPTLAVSVGFWPLLLGLALAAVAIAFRYSERLQRDTEGLI